MKVGSSSPQSTDGKWKGMRMGICSTKTERERHESRVENEKGEKGKRVFLKISR